MRPLPLAFGFLTLAAAVAAQDTPQREPLPERTLPAWPSAPLPPSPRAGAHHAPHNAPPPAVQVQLDDEVPAVTKPTGVETPTGDQVVAAPEGDRFYLGFAAGEYRPPVEERLDPVLLAQLRSEPLDGRPAPTAFAFVMFDKRITNARIAELESLGARVLGFHPGYTLKVALPLERLDAVATLPFVRWIGAARTWQKVHPAMGVALANTSSSEPVDAFISVFESDLGPLSTRLEGSPTWTIDPELGTPVEGEPTVHPEWKTGGWQEQALRDLGVEVVSYHDGLKTFRVKLAASALQRVLESDFVLFVEPDVPAVVEHDESTPMILADEARTGWPGTTRPVGIVDSGYDHGHGDLISTFAVGQDTTGTSGGAWSDPCGHGTHVAGTFFGDGSSSAGHRGVAPDIGRTGDRRVFTSKVFPAACSASVPLSSVISFQGTSYTDPAGTLSPAPAIVNNSWGSKTGGAFTWVGTETNPRLIDDEVRNTGRMWVFSAGNEGNLGAGTIGSPAVAKNAFTVGNIRDYRASSEDPGFLSSTSSLGPCGDGRWKPNVVAPGTWIMSALAGTANQYTGKSGTSMAAPHVSGLAAQAQDHYSYLNQFAEQTASVLMATAMTKDMQSLTFATDSHLDMYGAGKVNADTVHFPDSQASWQSWGSSLSSSAGTYMDFNVPVGTTRLVVVMHYSESAASAGASQALVNDYDLWIDQPPLTTTTNSGEWFVQRSAIDNSEIRVITNPISGTWRWKIHPESATTSIYYGVTVATIGADYTPAGTGTLTKSATYIKPNDVIDITQDVDVPEYYGHNVFVDSTSSANFHEAVVDLRDAANVDLIGNVHNGEDVLLGDIWRGFDREVRWKASWPTEGIKSFSTQVRSENMANINDSVQVYVDGTPPPVVSSFASTTHTPGVWSNNPNVTFNWTAPFDPISGLDGYSKGQGISQSVATPNSTKDLPASATSFVATFGTGGAFWGGLRAVDRSGNWNAAAFAGPFKIDLIDPTGVGSLKSTTHTVNVSNCSAAVTMKWNAATDTTSGIAGYRYVFDHSASTNVSTGSLQLAAGATSHSQSIGSSASGWYFHIRARDVAGNWGPTVHAGPYFVDTTPWTTYCTGKVNSLGCTPSIDASGAPSASASSGFVVTCSNVRNNKAGLLFYSTTGASSAPFQGGTLCVASPVKRTPAVNSGGSPTGNNCSGTFSMDMAAFASGSLGGSPLPALKVPGTVVRCQWWGRDGGASFGTSLSDALRYGVCQ